ncbi:DNA adenine methylase [archaeon]|jgi:DNA adenine methylase|nr:DNA adenine methylase [archaeon]MBT4209283.1 DNA adenine methylase [Candidatus Woesearchaeota archaeon]MBT4730547.1 DNA adenine methylase [Candidatus Woesearchaeota archaeon]MBT7555526.1 DNA adenine methylase [Candidatus Woesearchaeota archaeon]
MKYMGSKNRIAKYILPIILKNRTDNQWYVEPFCGGLNTIDKAGGKRLASDKNKYLISMWKGLCDNKKRPNTISKELYSKARVEFNNNTNIEFDDFMIGWIGWMASYNGRFFDGGYSGHSAGKTGRNYINEQIRNVESQIDKIRDIKFVDGNYNVMNIPDNSIIYCDPPYKNTKQYLTSKNFDHDNFWQWCREMTNIGHDVFISEYNAPDDFGCIWEKNITNSMNTTNTHATTEKLFKFGVIDKNRNQHQNFW